jgi:tetratricopeptide (TPR) repeat protein
MSFPDTLDYGIRLASTLIPMGQGQEALAILGDIRKRFAAGPYDPRIDLTEAEASSAVSEFQRARDAAGRVAAHPSAAKLPSLVARARLLQARAFTELGDSGDAIRAAGESRRLYELEHHQRGVSMALNILGAGQVALGDLAGSRKTYEASLEIARELGNQSGMASAIDSIASIVRQQGDFDQALRLHAEALAIRRRTGSKTGVATSLGNMASALHERGQLSEARRYADESLALRHELKQRRGVGRAMNLLAPIIRKQGDLLTAESMSREAARILDEVGDRDSAVQARLNLGVALCDRGSKTEARKVLEEVAGEARAGSDRSTLASALFALGRLAMYQNDLAEARRHLEESFRLRHELGERSREALTRIGLAELTIGENRPGAGELLARQAIEEFRKERVVEKEAWAYAVLSRTLAAQAKTAEARKALERATLLLREVEQREIRLAVEKAAETLRAAR